MSDSEEPLPPPPPELFRSNLSLDSLPPPPAPGEFGLCSGNDLSGSQLSLMSLPPPPGTPQQQHCDTLRKKKITPTNTLLNNKT